MSRSLGYIDVKGTLNVGDAAGAEVVNIDMSQNQATPDATSFDSDDMTREYIAGWKDGAAINFTMIDNAGTRAAWMTEWDKSLEDALLDFSYVSVQGGSFTGTCIITSIGRSAPLDDKVVFPVSVQICGKLEYSPA